jgi:hypothetical protein
MPFKINTKDIVTHSPNKEKGRNTDRCQNRTFMRVSFKIDTHQIKTWVRVDGPLIA